MAAFTDFAAIPRGGYSVILADPPWRFATRSQLGQKKNAEGHYATMTLAEILALPVAELANPKGCALFLWATPPMLQQGLDVMKAWGFAYRSIGAWAKRSRTGAAWQFGTGYVFRSAMEPYLFGSIGRPVQTARNVRNLIVAPVREHSRKPEEIYADAERLFAGPRLELFSRQPRPGWDCFGNQLDRFEAPVAA